MMMSSSSSPTSATAVAVVGVDSSKGGGWHPRAPAIFTNYSSSNNNTAFMEGRRVMRWMEDCSRDHRHHHANYDDDERH